MEQIEILGWMVYPYSLLAILTGAALTALFACLRIRRAGLPGKAALASVLLSMILCPCLARIAYCLCDYEWLQMEGPVYFFSLNDGGWLSFGALLGLLAALLSAARMTRCSFGKLADAWACPALITAAALHLADGLAGEGYGWGVDDWLMPGGSMSVVAMEDASFFHRLPFAVGNYYGEWRWAVFILLMLELLVLCGLLFSRKTARPGGTAALTLLITAGFEILGESLRQDEMIKWGFVRCNQLLYALAVVGVMILCIVLLPRKEPRTVLRSVPLLVLGVLLVILMEFALEGKISAIEWMTMDICYCISAAGCALMVVSVLPLWRLAFHSAPEVAS